MLSNALTSLFSPWRRPPLPIGVDIGADGIRMLQLEVVGDSVSVIGAARELWPAQVREAQSGPVRPPQPGDVRPILEKLYRQGEFVGRRIAIALPRELVRVKNVRMPLMPPDETQDAAGFEAQQAFENVLPSTHEIRAIPLGEVKQGTDVRQEVLLLAVKSSDVEALVEQWHAAGFAPDSIDFEPAAIFRAVERFVRRRDDESDVNVLVDIGHRRTNVVIGRGRELNFFKTIDIGGHQLNQAVAHTLGVNVSEARTLRGRLSETADTADVADEDPVRRAVYDTLRPSVEQIGREVGLCLRYFSVNFRGRRPARIRVVGGESRDPSVLRILGAALPVPVEVGRPVANADLSRIRAVDRKANLADWTVAFGLALKQCKGNFPDRLGATRDEQQGQARPSEAASPVEAAGPTRREEFTHA